MTAGELRSFYPFILFLTLIFVTSITVCLGVVLYELVLFRFLDLDVSFLTRVREVSI